MSRDRFDVLERFAPLFEAPEPSFERFVRRRDRKRKRQRLVAGVVAMAIFLVPVWIVATDGSGDRTSTPASRGPTVPPASERVGFIGLPPVGATPSTPEAGDVVLSASGRGARCGPHIGGFCTVWVYADGRLIWIADQDLPYGANERTTGLLEQRLTPVGVELLVSEFTSTGTCSSPGDSGSLDCLGAEPQVSFPAITSPGWRDPAWGLRAKAWEDAEIRPFVPARFGACFLQENRVSASSYATWRTIEPSRVLAWIPSSAADLLRGKDMEIPWDGLPITCFSLTSEEARAVSERLDEAGINRDEWMQPYVLGYQLVGTSRFPEPVLWIGPILPHGGWVVSGFG